MGVEGITNQNFYNDRDIDDLKDNEKVSTNAAINRLANHAGATDVHVLHGRDRTEGEIREEHRGAVAREGGKADGKELANMAREALVEHVAEHLGGAGEVATLPMLPVTLVKAQYEMMKAVGEDGIVGHDRAEAMTRDAMHVEILGNLNGLPQGYVDGERARFSKDAKEGTFTQRMTAQLGRGDNVLMGIMQLHCDQGMGAARAMYDAKQTPADYLRANPEISRRYQHDPAFRHGFDGMVFAHDNGQYDEVVRALGARDARYEAHHVAWRG